MHCYYIKQRGRGKMIDNNEYYDLVKEALKIQKRQKENCLSHVYNLRRCNLGGSSIKSIVESIVKIQAQKPQKDNYIVEIDLFSNSLSDLGCKLLAQLPTANLYTLILSANRIGDKGCRYLASGQWQNMATVILKFNCISNKGCEYLSKAKWKKLNILNLSDNEIGLEGFRSLSKMDSKNLNLHLFQLTNSKIHRMIYYELKSLGWNVYCHYDYKQQ